MKRVVVTLTDLGYFHKAKRTIMDARLRGEWKEEIVLITVGFNAPKNWLDFYNVIPFRVEPIDKSALLEHYRTHPLRPTCDDRETKKLTQWDKFYVFHPWFKQWNRVIYVDAGLRIFSKIEHLASLPCEHTFLAPDDAPEYDQTKRFHAMLELDRNPQIANDFFKEYNPQILQERYFLNCIWMYDTVLLDIIHMEEMIQKMNQYPICRCNEMTIMNLIFTFTYRVWKPFPSHTLENPRMRLFGWTEHDRDYGPYTTWRDFCFLKYPTSISFDCD